MTIRLPVGLGTPFEMMALDGTRKTTPLGAACDLQQVTGSHDTHINAIADQGRLGRGSKLMQTWEVPETMQMALLRLVQTLRVAESQLNSVIAILVASLDLDDDTRTGLNRRRGNAVAVLQEQLSHSYLLADDAPHENAPNLPTA